MFNIAAGGLPYGRPTSEGVSPNGNFLSFAFGETPQVVAETGDEKPGGLLQKTISGNRFSLILHHSVKATIRTIGDSSGRFSGVIWGVCFDVATGSPQIADETLLAAVASGRSGGALNTLGGLFVAVVLDCHEDKLHLVTDCLGARPFFTTEQKGALFGASHALWLTRFLSRPGRRDLDAVSHYFVFGYNATNKSLIVGIDRLDASSHIMWSRSRKISENYGMVQVVDQPLGYQAMAERIFEIVSRSYRNWTRGAKSLTFGLSGGYDSRLLCALSLGDHAVQKRYINIQNQLSETVMAREVAERLNLPLDVISMGNTDWDAFAPERIFHCRPDGFPVTKSVSRLVFRHGSSVAMVGGYLGDALIRGHLDMVLGYPEDPANNDTILSLLSRMGGPTLDIFKSEAKKAIVVRAYASAREVIENHKTDGHLITTFDIFMRQRSYISNNFLQNLDEMEPCLPFLDPELIALKRSYPYSDFGIQTYDEIFSRYIPQLAGLGHNKDLNVDEPVSRISKVQRQWIKKALLKYSLGQGRRFLNRRFIVPRLAASATLGKCSYVIPPMMFWDALKSVCLANDIPFG